MTAVVKKRAIVIRPDDTFTVDEIDVSLSSLQALVGGYIEAAMSNERGTIFCNEEGKLEGLPVNRLATWLWRSLAPGQYADSLVGTVVVLGPVDSSGDETDVTEYALKAFSHLGVSK